MKQLVNVFNMHIGYSWGLYSRSQNPDICHGSYSHCCTPRMPRRLHATSLLNQIAAVNPELQNLLCQQPVSIFRNVDQMEKHIRSCVLLKNEKVVKLILSPFEPTLHVFTPVVRWFASFT